VSALPTTILLAPQPNPSTSSVDFGYTVGSDQGGAGNVPVRLVLFDTRGKLVRVLKSETEPVGHYQVHWSGEDEHGARVRTGVYQYRLQVGSQIRAGKVIRI
jgi:flagellar hook assembly protein FlgD